MRALLILLPVALAGCGSNFITKPTVTQRHILKQSQAEIAQRESWAPDAAIFVVDTNENWTNTWKVRAGAFDYSDYPKYKGIYFVPGTERVLRFSSNGCLIGYTNVGNPCLSPVSADSTGYLTNSGK